MRGAASRCPTYPTIPHIVVRSLRRFQEGAVQLDGDAPTKEVDRNHQEALLGIRSHEDPLYVGEGAASDTHPLPLPKVRVGEDRNAGLDESLNRLDFCIGDGVESIPALTDHAHEPACLADLEVARLVHRVAQEEIAPEQRDARAMPHPATSGPRLDGGEERLEAFRGDLVIDELLAVAVGPKDAPARHHRLRGDLWQGFAPFGLRPSLGCETNNEFPLPRGR